MKKKLIISGIFVCLLMQMPICFAWNIGAKTAATPNQSGDATLNGLLWDVCCRSGSGINLDMLTEALRRGANPNYSATGYPEDTPFIVAIKQGDIEAVKILLAAGADPNMATSGYGQDDIPLYDAIGCGSFEIEKMLVGAGANVNGRLLGNSWPIMVAFSDQNMHNRTQVAMFNYLVSKGANINGSDNYGRTLLMASASHGNLELTQMYLALGADPHQRDANGKTALDYAVAKGSQDVIALLLPVTK